MKDQLRKKGKLSTYQNR